MGLIDKRRDTCDMRDLRTDGAQKERGRESGGSPASKPEMRRDASQEGGPTRA